MKAIIITLFVLLGTISSAQIREAGTPIKYFDGFYFGASAGSQNIWGGAFINELDLLAQKSALVVEFSVGYRKQLLNDRLLVGFELHQGVTDGKLSEVYQPLQMDVFYENNSQSGFGLTLGTTVGPRKRLLVFTYAKVTKRNFDISFTEDNGTHHIQEDGQRFLQYGIGAELALIGNLNLRAALGKVDVDFGNLVTSQDVEDLGDFNIGVVYHIGRKSK